MYEGMLTINFDPPFLGFNNGEMSAVKHCTSEDIHALLLQLGVELPHARDGLVRMHGQFADEHLSRFNLVPHLMPVRPTVRMRDKKHSH